MRKLAFLLQMFIITSFAVAQNPIGTLSVDWYNYRDLRVDSEADVLVIQLLRDDKVIEEFNGTYDSEFTLELPVGEYSLKAIYMGRVDYELHQVKVLANKELYINLRRPFENYDDSLIGNTGGIMLHALGGTSYLDGSEHPVPLMLDFGFDMYGVSTYHENLGIGFSSGFSFAIGYLDRYATDSLIYVLPPNNKERYFLISYNFELFHRFMLGKRDMYFRPFLDLGAQYLLPIQFRHASIVNNNRYVTKKLHRFNDFRLTARIGVLNAVNLVYRYRLVDFVRDPYPQIPRHEIGLAFTSWW